MCVRARVRKNDEHLLSVKVGVERERASERSGHVAGWLTFDDMLPSSVERALRRYLMQSRELEVRGMQWDGIALSTAQISWRLQCSCQSKSISFSASISIALSLRSLDRCYHAFLAFRACVRAHMHVTVALARWVPGRQLECKRAGTTVRSLHTSLNLTALDNASHNFSYLAFTLSGRIPLRTSVLCKSSIFATTN